MAGVALDDYLRDGPARGARRASGDHRGRPGQHRLRSASAARSPRSARATSPPAASERVRSATLPNTLVDFGEPGGSAAFTDQAPFDAARAAERRAAASSTATTSRPFNLLRTNDLSGTTSSSNWLMGESRPPSNPRVERRLDRHAGADALVRTSRLLRRERARARRDGVGGTRVDLAKVNADSTSSRPRATTSRRGGRATGRRSSSAASTRFVLRPRATSRGSSTRRARSGSTGRRRRSAADAGACLARRDEHQGSWWEDWARWAEERGGERRDPPGLGSDRYPVLGDAPGTYVLERSRQREPLDEVRNCVL